MKAKPNTVFSIRLASTTDLSRDQWLAIRSQLGSSDAAVAVGLPIKCPLSLWLEKTGVRSWKISPQRSCAVGN